MHKLFHLSYLRIVQDNHGSIQYLETISVSAILWPYLDVGCDLNCVVEGHHLALQAAHGRDVRGIIVEQHRVDASEQLLQVRLREQKGLTI